MTRFAGISATSALTLALWAGPALADLTAAQVWDDLEAYLEAFGYEISANENAVAGGLNLTDVTLSMTLPEDEGTMTFLMSEMTLAETGDGSVAISFPQSMPITLDVDAEDESVRLVLDYTHDNLDMTVSGDETALSYVYSADRLGLRLAELTVEGDVITRDMARFDLTMRDVKGTSETTYGDLRQISQAMTAANATYDMAFNDPESDDAALISGAMDALAFEGATALPEGFDPENMQAMAEAGFAANGTFGYQNGKTQLAVTEKAGTTNGETATGSAALTFALNGDALTYEVATSESRLSLAGPELPVPVQVQMDKTGFNVAFPVAASDMPQDFALGLTLGGFTMSELLWNIFDPGATLPRDPATVALDLTGQATPFVSIFDAEAMAELEDGDKAPGELNALTLQNLVIEAAGARLTGQGDFTFDNSDLETFDGMPRPIGVVNLTLDGANTLIDKLIQMGLMSEEDAMGARMMMSMFAVPGAGEDSLTSTLEINEQGHVLANGMRLQ